MNLIKIKSIQFSAARVKSNQIEIKIKSKIDSNHIKSNQIRGTLDGPSAGLEQREGTGTALGEKKGATWGYTTWRRIRSRPRGFRSSGLRWPKCCDDAGSSWKNRVFVFVAKYSHGPRATFVVDTERRLFLITASFESTHKKDQLEYVPDTRFMEEHLGPHGACLIHLDRSCGCKKKAKK